MKLEKFSEAKDRGNFLERFGSLPQVLYPERPLPPAAYWGHLIDQFPEDRQGALFFNKDGKDIGTNWMQCLFRKFRHWIFWLL